MTVDVIIPSYKPGRSFHELLRRLEAQTLKPGHILIINTEEKYFDPSLTEGIASAEVFHITKAEFDHGATRNMGAGFSNADILVFMTDDAMPADRHLIANLAGAFSEPSIKAVWARQLPGKNCPLIEGFTRRFNYPEEPSVRREADLGKYGIKTFFCSNVCAAYDRGYFNAMGGFTEPCIFNEDMIFGGRTIRSGMAIAYAPEAKVYHSHDYNAIEQFHRYFDNGVSQAMHPEVFRGVASSGEGMKLVRATMRFLTERKKGYLIPSLIFTSGMKFLGFRLGRLYRHLPLSLIKAFSLNKTFWDKKMTVD